MGEEEGPGLCTHVFLLVSAVWSECGYDSFCSIYSQRLLMKIRLSKNTSHKILHSLSWKSSYSFPTGKHGPLVLSLDYTLIGRT